MEELEFLRKLGQCDDKEQALRCVDDYEKAKEKQNREKGCGICSSSDGGPHLQKDWLIGIDGNANGHPGHAWACKAQFCPLCGRELEATTGQQ